MIEALECDKKNIKLEYCKYIGDERQPVNSKNLPNSLYQKIRKNWDSKNSFDEELFNEGLLKSAKISWTEERVFETYKNICLENDGPVFDLKEYGGLNHGINKFFKSKYDLERLLGYHDIEKIKPIVTTYEKITEIENPKYLLKRFGDYEKGYTGEEEILIRELLVHQKDYKNIKELSEPSLMKVKDLDTFQKRFFYGVKINDKSIYYDYDGAVVNNSASKGTLVKTIDVDDSKLWWLVGRWLGDGWLRDAPRKTRANSKAQWVLLCCGKHELKELVDFFENFQVKAGYHEERTVFKFKITLKEWFDFFSQFGKYAKGKFIPEKVKNLPIQLLKELLDGYFSADGSYDEKKDKWSATSIGEKLILDIVECIEKVYKMPVSLTKNKKNKTSVIEGRVVNNSTSYTIGFKKDIRLQDKCFYENGYLWYPINYVTNIEEENKIDYSDEVWRYIEGSDNKFSVSNFGRIKSHKNNNKLTKISYSIGRKRLTKRKFDETGYVRLSLDKINNVYRVHELVWSAFGKFKKEDDMSIVFIDGNIKNCHIDNLTYEKDITQLFWLDKENCRTESQKYNTRTEFKKNNLEAFRNSRKFGWLDEFFLNRKLRFNSRWDKEKCLEESLKYETRKEFRENSKNAHDFAWRHGFLNEICSHMPPVIVKFSVPIGYWDIKENCKKEASKYKLRSEFAKKSSGAFKVAKKNGWLDEFFPIINNPAGHWNIKENCKKEASKYKLRGEFRKKSSGAYKAANRNGWLDEFFPKNPNEKL